MDVVHERPWPVEAELRRREIQTSRDPQAVVRFEGSILAGGEELGGEPERTLPGERNGLALRGVEHVQLRRARRGAERRDEAVALLVEVDPVQHTSGELGFAHEHTLDRECTRRLLERSGVCPRTAVDVVDEHVPVVLEMVDALELADAFVVKPVDRDRVELSRP